MSLTVVGMCEALGRLYRDRMSNKLSGKKKRGKEEKLLFKQSALARLILPMFGQRK